MRRIFVPMLLACATCVQASVQLASLFGDHMVLQRNARVTVWGWAKPSSKLSVEGSWGSKASVTVDSSGSWRTYLKTGAAGGPYSLRVRGDGEIVINDVLVGEVWICSGQSNMEMTVNKGYAPPLLNQEVEIRSATYPKIRMFNVVKNNAPKPVSTCQGAWQVCLPSSVGSFSAAGFFFARSLFASLNVPVGMIHTSWGGTEVELWTSHEGMNRVPFLAQYASSGETGAKIAAEAMAKYSKECEKADIGTNKWTSKQTEGWAHLDSVGRWSGSSLQNFDGSVWYQAEIAIPQDFELGDSTLSLGAIDDEDQTWVNGTKVGETRNYAANREYSVPSKILHAGANLIVVRAFDTGGEGGFSGPAPALTVGTKKFVLQNWRYRVGLDLKDHPAPKLPAYGPSSGLFNGMIAPLAPYAIRGAIWYQGESNVGRADHYRESFANMIDDWRRLWGQGDFPFYYVQIAPFNYNSGIASAKLREAQLQVLREKNTGMAVITDITDDFRDIHPINKQGVGKRLALWALAKTYHQRVEFSGPLFQSFFISGTKVLVKFSNARGLSLKGVAGFEVAGADQKFHKAEVKIEGNQLIAWSRDVLKPVALRYGFQDAIGASLFNGSGLPASPFRTDNWKN